MFHAWRVESKREERSEHERNTKKKERKRERQKEKWQGKKYNSLVSWKVTHSTRTLVKGKGSFSALLKKLFIFSSFLNFSHFLSWIEVLLVE